MTHRLAEAQIRWAADAPAGRAAILRSLSPIQSVNIAAAALITQFSLVGIFVMGLIIIRLGEPRVARYDHEARSSEFAWILLIFTVVSLGALLTAGEFVKLWAPVFGQLDVPRLALHDAVLLVFILDALCTSILVYRTEGSRASPFAAIFFAIPALAIFLRQPTSYVVVTSVLVVVLFTFNLIYYKWDDRGGLNFASERIAAQRSGTGVFWVVAVATFILTTWIGVITQPR